MPTKPRVEPDLTALRWCRLLEAIRAAVPVTGVGPVQLSMRTAGVRINGDYSREEYRAATKALRECGAITYKRGLYLRGEMF